MKNTLSIMTAVALVSGLLFSQTSFAGRPGTKPKETALGTSENRTTASASLEVSIEGSYISKNLEQTYSMTLNYQGSPSGIPAIWGNPLPGTSGSSLTAAVWPPAQGYPPFIPPTTNFTYPGATGTLPQVSEWSPVAYPQVQTQNSYFSQFTNPITFPAAQTASYGYAMSEGSVSVRPAGILPSILSLFRKH